MNGLIEFRVQKFGKLALRQGVLIEPEADERASLKRRNAAGRQRSDLRILEARLLLTLDHSSGPRDQDCACTWNV